MARSAGRTIVPIRQRGGGGEGTAAKHLLTGEIEQRKTDPNHPVPHLTYPDLHAGRRVGIVVNETQRHRSVNLHTHAYFEIALVGKYSAVHHYGARSYTVECGDILVVSPFIPHGYSVDAEKPFELVNVNFTMDALGDALNDPVLIALMAQFVSGRIQSGAHRPGLIRPVPLETARYVYAMLEEYNETRPGSQTVLQSLLRLLLVGLYRTGAGETTMDEVHSARAILGILPELHAAACADSTVSALASKVGLSPGYFGRQFRKLMGETVTQYTQRVRVFKAVQLLCTTDWVIEDVAARVGYRDTGTFRDVFKRVTGHSPSHYRA